MRCFGFRESSQKSCMEFCEGPFSSNDGACDWQCFSCISYVSSYPRGALCSGNHSQHSPESIPGEERGLFQTEQVGRKANGVMMTSRGTTCACRKIQSVCASSCALHLVRFILCASSCALHLEAKEPRYIVCASSCR